MFTGLIEKVGEIKKIYPKDNYLIAEISANLKDNDLKIGDSISCDGACLTVSGLQDSLFEVRISQETISKTIAGEYKTGSLVNLERALKVGDRLGGHMVSGHIDDLGQLELIEHVGQSVVLIIKHDKKFDNFLINKGSVAVNGISLTINESGSGWFVVNIIPQTVAATTVTNFKPDDKLNLEFDMVGKYINKHLLNENNNKSEMNISSLTKEKIK